MSSLCRQAMSDYIMVCDVCRGRRKLPNGKKCFACGGSGKRWGPEPESQPEEPPTELDPVLYVLSASCENGCDHGPGENKPHKASVFSKPIRCGKCKWGLMTFELSPEARRQEAQP